MKNYERRAVVLTSDIDMTLQAGDWHPQHQAYADTALDALTASIARRKHAEGPHPFYVGTSTGRTLESHRKELEAPKKNVAFRRFVEVLDTKTGSVGAEIEYRRKKDRLFVPLKSWPGTVAGWDRQTAARTLRPRLDSGELELQANMAQSPAKLSYDAHLSADLHDGYADIIERELREYGRVSATVTFSGGRYLDILPRQASGDPINKGTAQQVGVRFLAEYNHLAEEPVAVFAGDSENDEDGLAYAIESGGFGIIPANAKDSFKRKMSQKYPKTRLHIARTARFAMAIQEGLEERGILGGE